ncbi:MAG: hypothetical protein HYW07_00345 [Candidatus Latescibacteria bacterium]|nr:hypothetical protein [Candidatus Latescibacterota bacterium]
MKISHIELFQIQTPRFYGHISGHVLVRVSVDEGPSGWGEAAGLKCLIGTDQESDLGTAAQVHLGVAMPNLDLPCDPMGPVLYTASAAKKPLRVEGSYIYPPEEPGLGVEIDEDKLRALTVAAA